MQEVGLALLALLVAAGAINIPSRPDTSDDWNCRSPAQLASGGRVLLVCLEKEDSFAKAAKQLAGVCALQPPKPGERTVVGKDCRAERGPMPGAARIALGLRLDLNRASEEDLEELPGIGPTLARRIVDWRRQNGPFTDLEQLREVSGIGEKRLQAVREMVEIAPQKDR